MSTAWNFSLPPRSAFVNGAYRNLPQEDADRLKASLNRYLPDPINPSIEGDAERYKLQWEKYSFIQQSLQPQISYLENLAMTVEMAINPVKRQKAVSAFQKLKRKSPEMKALKQKLKRANNPHFI